MAKQIHHKFAILLLVAACCLLLRTPSITAQTPAQHAIVLHAARLLDVENAKIISPGEILIEGDRIKEAGVSVTHPAGAETIDLGDSTLMPGLIDVHVHLFLHPGAEDLQTVQESVPERTILATLAARADLMAGFTAERDMGTEGAGSADTSVRNAIDRGLLPGPRLRISGNAISVLGGHEDAINYNPDQHIMGNATYANNEAELITVMRQQFKEGADFIKIYETGRDTFRDGQYISTYQYTEAELTAAVREAARMGKRVGVHATGEPGTGYAARRSDGGRSRLFSERRDHAHHARQKYSGGPNIRHLRIFCRSRGISRGLGASARIAGLSRATIQKTISCGSSDGVRLRRRSFPHGTQARELELMVKYGMTPAARCRRTFSMAQKSSVGKNKSAR